MEIKSTNIDKIVGIVKKELERIKTRVEGVKNKSQPLSGREWEEIEIGYDSETDSFFIDLPDGEHLYVKAK